MPENHDVEPAARTPLTTLALLFFRLGATSFGGPAAHIAMMQNEVVHHRRWMTEEEFLDLVSACNLIPGPNSTEMAIHIGYRQAGWAGLIVAGTCFIFPAAAIVLGIAWAYVRYSTLPAVNHLMAGIKPVIIAIIIQALIALSKSALKNTFLKVLCVFLFIMCFFFGNELVLLLAGGAISLIWAARKKAEAIGRLSQVAALLSMLCVLGSLILFFSNGHTSLPDAQTEPFSLHKLFWYFTKIGSALYGSGYVLLAFLRSDLVESWHWLTSAQLLDATAVGQITPGPVFTTATFIGYLLASLPGALVATAGIFLPDFVFVAITASFIHRPRASKIIGATLDGINVASLALMAFVMFQLGKDSLTQPLFIGEALIAALALWKFNINPTWLILAGAVIGILAVRE